MNALPRLYAIADAAFGDPVSLARDLFAGGARLLQVRDKAAPSGTLFGHVEQILRIRPADALVIVNDRADIARLAGASGVHLGQDDLTPESARAVLLPDQIVGLSTHNLAQAMRADDEPVDYIAVGPVFATATKANAEPALGLEGLNEICRHVRKPVVAIGGITLESARAVLDCGASSVAVISGILKSGDIATRTKEWVVCVEPR